MTWRGGVAAFVIFLTAIALPGHAAAEEKRLSAALAFPDRPVMLFDGYQTGARKVMAVPPAEFPAEVLWLGTSDSNMHHIRLTAGGPDYWVDGSRVKIAGKPAPPVLCEANQKVSPGYTGRGLGEETNCKLRKR